MRVLVWQSYGFVNVYEAGDNLFKIFDLIAAEVSTWGMDDSLKECIDEMSDAVENQRRQESALRHLVEKLKHHESFEVFEFVDVKIP